MDSNAVSAYWETQVLTASPQKLRLMLIDGAIRFGRQVLQFWGEGKYDDAFTAMMRMQNIIFEILTSSQQNDSELNRSIASIYLFIYKTLIAAQRNRDRKGVEDALMVLAEERETWRQVCEKFSQTPTHEEVQKAAFREIKTSNSAAIHASHFGSSGQMGNGDQSFASQSKAGFSVDA